MKRNIALILCIALLGLSVYADINIDSVSVDNEKFEVTVSGSVTNTNDAVGLYIYLGEPDDANFVTTTAAFEQKYANPEDKKFSFTAGITEGFLDKPLKMEITQKGETKKTSDLYIMRALGTWLGQISGATTVDVLRERTKFGYDKALFSLVTKANYDKYLTEDVMPDDAANLVVSNNLYNLLLGFKSSDYSSPQEYADDINRAILITEINGAADAAAIKTLLTKANLELLGIDDTINDGAYTFLIGYRNNKSNSETLKTTGTGFINPSELSQAIKEANCLALINIKSATDMKAVLDKYADTLTKVNAKFSEIMEGYSAVAARAITNQNFTKLSTAITTLSTAITNQGETESDLGGGNNSSGSGGSGGGAGSPAILGGTPSVPTPEVVPEGSDSSFNDMKNHSWADEAVESLFEMRIISGKGGGKFAPEDGITREEFVKMAVLLLDEYDANAECSFSDIDKNNWSYPYIASANKCGLTSGVGDGKFGVGEMISRQDIVTILYRAVMAKGIKNTAAGKSDFSDKNEISDYATEAVEMFHSLGIVNGMDDGSFAPRRGATRAEGAVIIYNVYKLLTAAQ